MTDRTDAVSIEMLRSEFLKCRTIAHAWFEAPADDLQKPDIKGDWWLNVACERCTTRRIDLISESGERISRRYKHPKQYQLDEKLTLDEMRVEWAHRAKLGRM
jgi:hypothetical protein